MPPPPPPPGLTAPAGYVAYNTPATTHGTLSPIRGMAKWASILAILAAVLGLGSAALQASVASKAQDFLDGNISEQSFLDANALAPLGQVLSAVPLIAAGVFAVIWMFRMSNNVRALGRTTTFAPVWAIIGWILPPFVFVLPLLVLRELWKSSTPEPDAVAGSDGWRSGGENPLLYVWFVVYGLIPAVITVINIRSLLDGFSLGTDTRSVAETAATSGPTMIILSGVLGLVSAAIWVVLVRQFTARHTALTAER